MVTRGEVDEVGGRTIYSDEVVGPSRPGRRVVCTGDLPSASIRTPRGWRTGSAVVILFACAGVAEWHTQRT